VHVAPACAGSGEGSDRLGLFVRSLSLHFCKRLVPGLEPMTSWSQGSSFTTAPRLPFIIHNYLHSKFPKIINRFCLANSHKDSFVLSLSTVISAVGLRETSASDIGVSGDEDTSLLSLLCLDSNNLFTVIIGVR